MGIATLPSVFQNRVIRPVRLFTAELVLDGLLHISLGARTLDELNLTARSFLTLFSPRFAGVPATPDDNQMLVNKASILMALEIPDLGASLERSAEEVEIRSHGRAALRLSLGPFGIEAYVHVGPGGDALLRLNQAAHPFTALQHATVTGGGQNFSTPFLAVNRGHVLWAQELFNVSAVPEDVAAGAAGESG